MASKINEKEESHHVCTVEEARSEDPSEASEYPHTDATVDVSCSISIQSQTDAGLVNAVASRSIQPSSPVQTNRQKLEEYYNSKLEINSLEQTISQLTISLKEKESSLLTLQMRNAQEASDSNYDNFREGCAQIDELINEKKEYIIKNQKLETENQDLAEVVFDNKEKLARIEKEIKTVERQMKEATLVTELDEPSWGVYANQLIDSEAACLQTKKELANQNILLDYVNKKFDQSLHIIQGLRAIETAYKQELANLTAQHEELLVKFENLKKKNEASKKTVGKIPTATPKAQPSRAIKKTEEKIPTATPKAQPKGSATKTRPLWRI